MAFSNGQLVQAADLNNFSVTTVTTTGTVTVGTTLSVGTDLTVSDDIAVTDDATIGGDLAVTGAVTVTGELSVAGATGVVRTASVALTDGATVALNAALGGVFTLTAAGNRTILAPTNAVDGQKIVIRHVASGGARTLTLTTGSAGAFRFGTDITAVTATNSGLTDYIGCVYNSTASRWDVVAYVKGY